MEAMNKPIASVAITTQAARTTLSQRRRRIVADVEARVLIPSQGPRNPHGRGHEKHQCYVQATRDFTTGGDPARCPHWHSTGEHAGCHRQMLRFFHYNTTV